jgi:hypothetical protein
MTPWVSGTVLLPKVSCKHVQAKPVRIADELLQVSTVHIKVPIKVTGAGANSGA